MPELPDVEVYVERLSGLFGGERLLRVRLKSPFLLRSVSPPLPEVFGKRLLRVERLGKRLVMALEEQFFIVLHLMIAGRLKLVPSGAPIPGKVGLAAFDFESATVILTEASSKKRASLHVVQGRQELRSFDRGGLEPLTASLSAFREALVRENRTVKRALVDPRLFSGIGNAYSDEMLHRARLSPLKRTHQLEEPEVARLYEACLATLHEWTDRLRIDVGQGFPEKVTAFRAGMAVHGRYRQPCPVCGTLVQRIRFADNEVNYCPRCQTGGKLLADRALSQLLKKDWPKSIEELEERLAPADEKRATPSTAPAKSAPKRARKR